MHPSLVRSDTVLREVVGRAAEVDEICIDCEFHSEGRYYPNLCLVQLAVGAELVAIDAHQVDLKLLAPILLEPRLTKVLHDGRQDLPILARAAGVSTIARVFDTQIAAGFIGHGGSIGYGALVREACGVELDKSLQVSDWTRELSDAQIEYALDDVRYLGRVALELRSKLEVSGRREWADAACADAARRALTRTDPDKLHRRVASTGRLSGPQLGILREVAKWRDRVASSLDKPLPTVANDLALKSLALQPPRDLRALDGVRGLGAGRAQPWARELLEAVARGAANPEPPARSPLSRDEEALIDGLTALLGVARRIVAAREGIAAEVLADQSELRSLVEWHLEGRSAPCEFAVLGTWRRALLGELLLAVLGGEVALRADATAPGGIAITAAR